MYSDDYALIAYFDLLAEAPLLALRAEPWLEAARKCATLAWPKLSKEFGEIVAEELLIKVLTKTLRKYRPDKGAKFATLFKTIYGHSRLDQIRKDRRRPPATDSEFSNLQATDELASDYAASNDACRIVRAFLGRFLSRQDVRLFELIAEGYSYREIAAQLGGAESQLRIRVYQARLKVDKKKIELLRVLGLLG